MRTNTLISLVACFVATCVLDGRCAEPQNNARPNLTAETNDGDLFRKEDVVFKSTGIALNGTLTYPLPGNRSKYPAIVLIHGTGSTDRDGTIPMMKLTIEEGDIRPEGMPSKEWAMKPYKEMAEGLSTNGYAVLRFDKRGWAEGGNDQVDMTLDLLCEDVVSALSYLKTRADIDHQSMFVLGHSEGGIVAQKLAADLQWLRGIILYCAPITPLHELTHDQTAYTLRLAGATESDIDKALYENNCQAYEKIRKGKYPEQTFNGSPTLHWRSLILHDPMATLRKCPLTTGVLILGGAKDWQIPPREATRIYNELVEFSVALVWYVFIFIVSLGASPQTPGIFSGMTRVFKGLVDGIVEFVRRNGSELCGDATRRGIVGSRVRQRRFLRLLGTVDLRKPFFVCPALCSRVD